MKQTDILIGWCPYIRPRENCRTYKFIPLYGFHSEIDYTSTAKLSYDVFKCNTEYLYVVLYMGIFIM